MALLPALGIAAGGGLLNKLLSSEGDYEDILRNAQAEIGNIPLADLEAFQYSPEAYQYSTVTEDPTMRTRQMALLERLGQLGETGLSDADRASYAQATGAANQAAGQRSAALMNEMRARGQGGSGLEYALREQAGQESLTRAANQGLQQAGDSARQRALYQQAYGNALAGQRDQDYRSTAANTDIINRFNQLNTGTRNEAALGNLQRRNDVAQQRFQNQLSKSQAKAGMTGQVAQANAANTAANNALISNAVGMGSMIGLGEAGYGPWAKPKKPGDM